MDAAGTEAAFYDAAVEQKRVQRYLDLLCVERKSRGYLVQRKRAMSAGVAAGEFEHRRRYRFEKGSRESWR